MDDYLESDEFYDYFGSQIKDPDNVQRYIDTLSEKELDIHAKRSKQGLDFYF